MLTRGGDGTATTPDQPDGFAHISFLFNWIQDTFCAEVPRDEVFCLASSRSKASKASSKQAKRGWSFYLLRSKSEHFDWVSFLCSSPFVLGFIIAWRVHEERNECHWCCWECFSFKATPRLFVSFCVCRNTGLGKLHAHDLSCRVALQMQRLCSIRFNKYWLNHVM